MDKKMVIASAAAALFVLGTAGSAMAGGHEAQEGKVKCVGGNSCKGHGECQTATHDCGGKNECKGKGWVSLSADECKDAGGAIEES
jgi:hypothetical protein